MRKWLAVAIVLVVVAAAAGLAVNRLDAYLDRNKALLVERASAALGRRVALDRIEVTLRSGPGVRVTGLRIADDPAYSSADFLRTDTATVSLRLRPLLSGRTEIERVDLGAAHLAIIRTASGFNLQSLARPAPPPPPTAWLGAQPAFAAAESALPPLPVGSVTVRNGTIAFTDRTVEPPVELRATQVDLTASNLEQTAPPRLEIAAAVLEATQRNLHLAATVASEGASDAAQLPFDLTFDLGPVRIGALQRLPAAASVLPAALSIPDSVFVRGTAQGPLDQLAVTATVDASQTAVQYGSLFAKSKSLPMTVDIEAIRARGGVGFRRLQLHLGEIPLNAKGQVSGGAEPAMELVLVAPPAPLAAWARLVPGTSEVALSGTAAANLHVRGRLSGSPLPRVDGTLSLHDVGVSAAGRQQVADLTTAIAFKGDAVDIAATRLKIRGVPVEVTAALRDPQAPQIDFSVKAEALPLTALELGWPAANDQLYGVALEATARGSESGAVWHGALTATGGRVRDVELGNLHADLGYGGGLTTLQALELQTCGGTLSAQGTYDNRDHDAPAFEARATVHDIALAPLVAAADPKAAAQMEGTLQAQMAVTGTGRDWTRIQPTLAGTAEIAVADGVVKDVNVAEEVLSGVTGIAGVSQLISARVRGKYPALFGTADTRFSQLGATLHIAAGQAATDDLVIAAPDYTIRANGNVGFDGQVDLAATLQASNALSADVIADAAPARYLAAADGRIEIPFFLRGRLPKVRVKPDAEIIGRALERALGGKDFKALLKKGRRLFAN